MKRGPDISRYQSTYPKPPVDFDLAAEKADFFIIKATEGDDWVDPFLEYHVEHADRVGKPWGLYHFYLARKDPVAQFDHYMETTEDLRGTISGSLDVEDMYGSTPYLLTSGVLRFLRQEEDVFGQLYSNRDYLDYKLTHPVEIKKLVKIWFAWPAIRFESIPAYAYPKWYGPEHIVLWQRSWWEPYPGIKGGVDDNYFVGDNFDLWVAPSVPPNNKLRIEATKIRLLADEYRGIANIIDGIADRIS